MPEDNRDDGPDRRNESEPSAFAEVLACLLGIGLLLFIIWMFRELIMVLVWMWFGFQP